MSQYKIQVKDVLESKHFQSAEVIAGEAGLLVLLNGHMLSK
ncbi:hypothetical protein [Lysinibacillus fusiformis]